MAGSSSDHGEVLTIFEETFGSVVEHEVIKMILQSCDWDTVSAQTALLEMIDPADLPKHIQSAVIAGSIVSAVPGTGNHGIGKLGSFENCVDTEISEDVCGSEGFWSTVEHSYSVPNLRDKSESPPLESLDYVERVLAESKTEYFVGNIEEKISEDMSKWQNIEVSNPATPELSSSTSLSSSPHTPGQVYDVSKQITNNGLIETSSSPSPSKISPPELPVESNSSLYNTAQWVLAPEFKPNAFWGPSEAQGPLAAGMNRSIGKPFNNWEPVNPKPLTSKLSDYLLRKNQVDIVKEKISSGSNIMVILRGLPGSGKSSLGRELRGGHGAILSTDDFFCDKYGTYRYDPSKITEAHTWNKRRAMKRIGDRKTPVIIDNTNMEIWEFKPYIKMGLDAGYEIEILEPDTPWKMTPNILAQKNTHGVPKQKIIQMKSRYQPINSLENLLSECGGTSTKLKKEDFLKDYSNSPVHFETKSNKDPVHPNTKNINSPINQNKKVDSPKNNSKSNSPKNNSKSNSPKNNSKSNSPKNNSPTNNSPSKSPKNKSTKTKTQMNFKYHEIKHTSKRHGGLNQDLISENTKTNTNIDNVVNGFMEGSENIGDTTSSLHLQTSNKANETSSIIPLEKGDRSSNGFANISDTQNGLSLLQSNYSVDMGQTFLSDDELELDDGPDVIIEDDSDEEQDQNIEIKRYPLPRDASEFGQDALSQQINLNNSSDMASCINENEIALHSKDDHVENFVMPEVTRDEEDEIEKMLFEAEFKEMNKRKDELDIIENKEPGILLKAEENDAERHKKEKEIIIENMQNEESDSDWGDEENDSEDVNENNFKDLVQSFGSALKIQIANKSFNRTETHTQQNKDSTADDDDAAMYEFCNSLEEKIGENLSSLVIRPTNERENYSSLFSVIGNDEISEKQEEDKSMFSILNTTQVESIGSLDENLIIDLNQAINANVIHKEKAFDKTLDANSNIQTEKINLQAHCPFNASNIGSNESQLATGISLDIPSECLDNLSATLQTPATDSNVYIMNTIQDPHGNKQDLFININKDKTESLDQKESIVDVGLDLENLKLTSPQSTADISLSNVSNKDIDNIVNENDPLTSWECVSANAGECSIDWDAAEKVKEKEGEARSSKPSRDRRKRTGGDPSKWMMTNNDNKEPESPELSSWVPIASGQVSWDAPQNESKVFNELKAIITENATAQCKNKSSDIFTEGKESSVTPEIKVENIKMTKHLNEREGQSYACPEEVDIFKEASIPDLKTLSKEVIDKKCTSVEETKKDLSVGQSVSTTSSPLHTTSYTGAVPKVKRRAQSQSPNHSEKAKKTAKNQDFPFNNEHGVFDERSAANSALSEGLIIMGDKGMFLCTACESPILSIKTIKQHYLSKKHLERIERWKHHNKKTFSNTSGFELPKLLSSTEATTIEVEKLDAGTQTLSIDFQALQLDNNLYEVKILYGCKNYIPSSSHEEELEDGALTKGDLLLDKGTMTDGDVDVTIVKPLQNLMAFFPQINVEELGDVLEKCQNNCDWAINVLLDSGYEVANNIDTSFSQEDEADIEAAMEGETFSDIETSTTNDTREDGGSWGDNELSSEERMSRGKVKQSQDPNALASKKQIEAAFELSNSVDERVTRLIGKEYSSPKLNQVKKTKNNKKSGTANKKRSAPSSPAPKVPSAPSNNGVNVNKEDSAQYVTLLMDPLFAMQLGRMFGPAGDCEVDGECAEEDRRVILPLELCHQIHKYWAKTLDGKFKHEAEVLDQIIREDELLAKRLQEEENATKNVNIVENGDEAFQKDPPINFREIMELEQAIKDSEDSSPIISKEPTLSAKVNLQILCTEFPHVDPKAIEEQFKRCGGDYQSTEAVLLTVHGFHREEPKTIVASDIVLNDNFVPGRVSPVHGPPVVSYTQEEEFPVEEHQEEITAENPQGYRDEARVHYEQRQENYRKAQEAASRGMKAAAAYYARLGNEHAKELKKANQRASQKILEAVNVDKDANKIDLHLLHVAEALSAAQAYFEERERILVAQGMSSMKIQVITGYGVNSAGNVAKIKPAIKNLLETKKYEYWLPNPGMFEITLKAK